MQGTLEDVQLLMGAARGRETVMTLADLTIIRLHLATSRHAFNGTGIDHIDRYCQALVAIESSETNLLLATETHVAFY